MTRRVLTVIGARPQFIKAAAVSTALADGGVSEFVVHTGQHYDASMSDVFFAELKMRPPETHLDVGSGSHGAQTAAMLVGVEQAIDEYRPDLMLVYGDTNSTIAGALAAAKLHVPVAHVEAGLRSGNMKMPEELNRITTDHVSELLFAPTQVAVDHLASEGVSGRVELVGDVMFDATLRFAEQARDESTMNADLALTDGDYVLATIHRAESTDDRAALTWILDGLATVAKDARLVLPLHPRTRAAIERHGMTIDPGVTVIEPVGFLDMLRLESGASVIVTDSGGVQKEAFFQRTPCVTVRSETEWTELVDGGWNRLAPPLGDVDLASAVAAAIGTEGDEIAPYGDGDAASRIAESIVDFSTVWFASPTK